MSAFAMPKEIVANAAVRRRLLWDAAHVSGAAREIRDACAKDILFYVNAFCFTFDPRKSQSVIPFVTYPFQDDALLALQDAISSGHDVAIGKSRDMGASWLNIISFEWPWHFSEMKNFLMVSRNESYVDDSGNPKSLFWKIDFLHRHQPKWLLPSGILRRSMHIENCDNGSVIDGESTTGEVARGDRRTAILLDEFAAFDTKSGYNALTATQSATNCRIFNSTPKGSANAFHDVYKKSSAEIVTMHWSQHPEKSRGLYCSSRNEKTGQYELVLKSDWRGKVDFCEKGCKRSRKVSFPEDYPFILDGKLRSPWYDRECSRAVNPVEISQELDIDFSGSDYQYFDPIAVERYKDEYCREPEAVGDISSFDESLDVVRFVQNEKGRLRLFELPKDGRWGKSRRFVIGADVSAGTGASNSTFCVYDRQTTEKVAEYANPNILPDDFGRLVVIAARWFNDARLVPDRSGPTGEVFVSRVLAEHYTNIYTRRNTKKFGCPATDEPGVWLNPSVRTAVLQQYRDAIGHCTIVNRSAAAMDETLRFICTMDGNIVHSASANANDPSGARANHGDLVIADALASLCLSENEDREVAQSVETSEDTLAWRMEMVRRLEEGDSSKETIGKEWEP